jgi:murein DD-endopeptidase MepM/ murein hydrolase activator NlpD
MNRIVKRVLLIVVVVITLVACGGDQTAAVSSPSPSATIVSPTATPIPMPTPTVAITPTASPTPTPQPTIAIPTPTQPPPQPVTWSYPIAFSGRVIGDGFWMRHGFAVENTWFNPGYWHTGEDWYALDGNTAGALVLAVADGEVVYAGSNYPGRVVIVRHADDLYSMYGHLDPSLAVQPGDRVARGDVLGTVLRRGDDVPDHLHFEVRTFLTANPVNGDDPSYTFRCGRQCPPGPGYWPIDAPEGPAAVGYRNPTHLINRRFAVDSLPAEVIVGSDPVSPTVTLWRDLPNGSPDGELGTLDLTAGSRFALLDVQTGLDAPDATGATAYGLWYKLRLPDDREGWVAALAATTEETGSDGRASAIRFNLLPAVTIP